MFALLDKSLGYLLEEGEIKTFETGKDASDYAKEWNQEHSTKYQPRAYLPEQDCGDWKQRERERFQSGVYTSVLPSIAQHCREEHFVHVSKRKPEELAYTKDAYDGARDVQKRISVKGYLEAHAPDVSEIEREQLAQEHLDWVLSSVVKFAKTPDEIEEVYTNYDPDCREVAESCMRYEANYFASSEHPVRIYGAGDLAIAYLTNEDGQTIARALAWPAKRIYSRVYGSCGLHVLLKKLGYKKSCSYYGEGSGRSFRGARVLRIECDGTFVAPYIDGDELGLSCGKDDRYLVMSESPDFQCSEQDGLAGEEDSSRCERCESRIEECEGCNVHTHDWATEAWCDHCEENYAFRCDGNGEYYSSDHYAAVIIGNSTYSKTYAENNFFFCNECNEWSLDETVEVITTEHGGTDEMCEKCAKEQAFKCIVDDEIYLLNLAAPNSHQGSIRRDGWQIARYIGNGDPEEEAQPYHSDSPDQSNLELNDAA